MRVKRSRKVVVAASVAIVLAGGAAIAYWVFGGAGTGAATTASNPASGIVVSQAASTGALAPGDQVNLSGLLTNNNNTDIKVGMLTAEITGASNSGVELKDFSIVGNPQNISAVVKKGTPVAWSGMTLKFANSAVNQDNAKNTTVTIKYTLTPFVENVVVPMGVKTVTTVNGVRTVTIKVDKAANGAALVPGQQLSFWMGNGAPNGYACGGSTTSTYCNLTAPAPTCSGWGCTPPLGNVNATLPKVDADGVLFFQGPVTVAVQWQLVDGPIIASL